MNEFKELPKTGFPLDVEENETVWLYNDKTHNVMLAVMVYVTNEGWFWAESNGIVYVENGQIVTEAEIEDEYDFTHYCKLPKLPVK